MDSIDAAFADLDERYPGSRHNRRPVDTVAAKATHKDVATWDSRSYKKVIKGEVVEFFTIGALAAALDRPLVTIRLWIRTGKLPQSFYRMPTQQIPVFGPDGKPRGTRELKGRRLYTRGQIEAVIRIAQQHGILHAPRIKWDEHPTFSLEVADAWQQLNQN